VEKLANEKQALKEKSKHINGYKKKAIAGQIPTPKQKEIFDQLTDQEQGEIKAAITKAQDEKNAALYTATELEQQLKDALDGVKQPDVVIDGPLDMDNMVWYKDKSAGGNPGAFYKDTTTGKSYYIKTLKTEDIARNEVLASRLYESAGVEAPKYHYMPKDGQHFVASEVIEGISESQAKLTGNLVDNIHENFAVDAWLSNWDVVGLNYDNLVIVNNRAVRMDPGGALRYRAMGTLKGPNQFNDKVIELETFLDHGLNYQSASVFKNGTHDQLIIGVKKVLRITDEQIDDLIDTHGPRDPFDALALKATMKARREHLAKLYPEALEVKVAPIVEKPKGATLADVKSMEEARVNGHSISIDDDLIEDHNVRFSTYTNEKGKEVTVAIFKVTDKGQKQVESNVSGKEGPDIALADLKDKITVAGRGIGALVRDGNDFRLVDVQRVNHALIEITNVIKKAKEKGNITPELLTKLEDWKVELKRMYQTMSVGKPATPWSFMMDTNDLPDMIFSKLVEGIVKGLSYVQKNGYEYKAMNTHKSKITVDPSKRHHTNGGRHLAANPEDGVKIRMFNDESYLYNNGYVEIEVEGSGLAALNKTLDQIKAMGIPNVRTTKAVRTELFLDQTAYRRWAHLKQSKHDDFIALNKIDDVKERQVAKLKFINDDVGYDISKRPGWATKEATQAFGHGRNVLIRTDLDTPEYDKWAKDHVLYHAIGTLDKGGTHNSQVMMEQLKIIFDGGGTLISLLERHRRGILESDQALDTDYKGGGAGFIFTRIKSRKSKNYNGLNAAGLYFKPHKHMKRMDRVSYNTDHFGSQKENYLQQRAETPEVWANHAGRDRDETIFKDGLSLFDDLEKIVVVNETDRLEIIQWLRDRNYNKWPDGRELEDVIQAANL